MFIEVHAHMHVFIDFLPYVYTVCIAKIAHNFCVEQNHSL